MNIIQWHKSDGYFWLRVFGWGVHFVDRFKHPPLFSVRNGHIKEYPFGKYHYKFLRPYK